jgi:hypothetical protein
MSAVFTPPPPARLSRAVTRKFIARVVVGITSPMASVLFSKSCSRGNTRAGMLVGFHDRKSGLLPLSGMVTVVAGPRSRSSQQNVNGSPFGSLPLAVRMKGVFCGMV